MSRSIKKGPYVEVSLMKKVEEMNKTNEKRVIKTWSRASFLAFAAEMNTSRFFLILA